MNEKEFRERYAALQARTAVSPELRESTVERVVRDSRRNRFRSTAPHKRPAERFLARRWGAAAACLLVSALAVA